MFCALEKCLKDTILHSVDALLEPNSVLQHNIFFKINMIWMINIIEKATIGMLEIFEGAFFTIYIYIFFNAFAMSYRKSPFPGYSNYSQTLSMRKIFPKSRLLGTIVQ